MILAVDAMGGDNAPGEIVKGCVQAVKEEEGFELLLIGDEPQIKKILDDEQYNGDRIKIKHTTEVITNDDVPTKAIRTKKDSSIVVGFNLLKEKAVDCFISAGSSGALLTGGVLMLHRIKGVDRPAVASAVPTGNGRILLLDSGFNTNVKPENYVQFARLGSAYFKSVFKVENPRVGLINIGVEEEKGSETVKTAHKLLKETELNYVGNVESREFFSDPADVLVADGFTGNVMLKLIEGAADFFFGEIKNVFVKNLKSKLCFLALKKDFKGFKKKMDPDANGGAPLLGVDGLVIKTHGSSKARTVKFVVLKAKELAESTFMEDVKNSFAAALAAEEAAKEKANDENQN